MIASAMSTQEGEHPDLGFGMSPFEVTRRRRLSRASHDRNGRTSPMPELTATVTHLDPDGADPTATVTHPDVDVPDHPASIDVTRPRRCHRRPFDRCRHTSTMRRMSLRSMWGSIASGVGGPHGRSRGSRSWSRDPRGRGVRTSSLVSVTSRSTPAYIERGVDSPYARRVSTSSVESSDLAVEV
jgi:hypothetical protein